MPSGEPKSRIQPIGVPVAQETKQRQFLSGWKEIANYLGKGVRTVQRYEREMGLPILRPAGTSASSVTATKAELDRWFSAPHVPENSQAKRRSLKSETNKLRADFLQIDCDIAMTFVSIALEAKDDEKRTRTTRVAREAYDTIVRMKRNTEMGDAERDELDANLRRLEGRLKTLGQSS